MTGFFFIGHDGEKVVNSAKTLEQIAEVKKLECAMEHEGEQIRWDMLDSPAEPIGFPKLGRRTLFQAIVSDRRLRVDQRTMMADRPPIAVVTAVAGKAVRMEFYAGHDALHLIYDLRTRELQGKPMPRWLTSDPQAYNPYRFLQSIGFPVPDELIEAKDNEQKTT
ncbi:hypothetical protein M1N44_02415 [Dehalococcoidia bacterium]|nr:hypothetical protein [Dehalococcoidia bacterium]MCL0070612.1 hypothetical protein [Dehalococcoidia bacterium]MCL0092231.1 hypothetical protein [Dehalococcoidia bacterium]